ncbi:MAG: putative tricarboxylic transport rane protein [Thermoanaerobacteraceae bacterium]|nr:putative tricarboxylic transport rane protein [Thermoanaerobacteraceae bacterium]
MTKNTMSGIISIILGVFYLIMTLRIPVLAVGDQVGPKLFPTIVAAIAIICGVGLLVAESRSKNKNEQKISWDIQGQKDVYVRIALTIVAGLIYGFILDPLGYILSTIIFMLMVMFIINSARRILEKIGISVAFSVITYVVFATFLKLSLPRGILSF